LKKFLEKSDSGAEGVEERGNLLKWGKTYDENSNATRCARKRHEEF